MERSEETVEVGEAILRVNEFGFEAVRFYKLRREALGLALQMPAVQYNTSIPDGIVETAKAFEAYLRGDTENG